jgi:hypothetical protein
MRQLQPGEYFGNEIKILQFENFINSEIDFFSQEDIPGIVMKVYIFHISCKAVQLKMNKIQCECSSHKKLEIGIYVNWNPESAGGPARY